ncbi:hypothetical protein Q1695_011232 [Nippostrongylus brasiliensis]|nr:hypothetical protein Q1695_011232 [Nippostrongylus brasiliensis]
MRVLLAVLSLIGVVSSFQCSPDTILRMATDKRSKQLERECHLEKTGEKECETKNDLEAAWKEFTKLSDQYRQAVAQCRKTAAGSTKRYRKTRGTRHDIHHEEQSISDKVRPESEHFDTAHPIRTKRQLCKTKSSLELNQLGQDFQTHCERDNICLPDEDLPAGAQRDRFKELHGSRAKKYSAYLTQLSLCYGRLT